MIDDRALGVPDVDLVHQAALAELVLNEAIVTPLEERGWP